jgi:hypothetical protein
MIKIIYNREENTITVKTDKGKTLQTYYTCPNTVDAQCKELIISYIVDIIKKLCMERINIMEHVIYRDDCGKTEFYMRVLSSVDAGVKHETWENFLSTTLNKMEEMRPSKHSRYCQNYLFRIGIARETLLKYSNCEKYYIVDKTGKQLNLFDNQTLTHM